MTELHQAFRDATEHLDAPDLAQQAWSDARGRRARRTTLGALAAVVLLGGGVAWAVQDRVPHADVVDTPVPPTPTSTPSAIDGDPATQPIWDPFTVVDAPRRASVLPEQLSPPAEAPSIADSPLPDIVVAWPEEGEDLLLLASNGEWRSVPGTATAIQGSLYDVVDPVISPDGSLVAMSTDAGILEVEAATGDQRVVPWPQELAGPVDTRPALLWLPDKEGFVVLHWNRPWLVRRDGTGEPAPFGSTSGRAVPMVDPDTGVVRERRMDSLLTWSTSHALASVRVAGFGERFVTRFGLVVYVGNPGVASMGGLKAGPIVVDPETGQIVAYTPIRDRDSVYSDNGHLTPLGLLDEETVVLLVTPMDFRTMEPSDGVTHLITWNHRTGEFELMASGGPEMRRIDVAVDLLE